MVSPITDINFLNISIVLILKFQKKTYEICIFFFQIYINYVIHIYIYSFLTRKIYTCYVIHKKYY